MERIDVALASLVRPANINRGTVIGIDRDGKRRSDALLPQGWSVRPRDGNALDHQPPRQFVRWVFQRLKWKRTSCSCIIADHDDVARCNCAIEFSPAKEGCVDGVVAGDRRANRGAILSRGLSRFDGNGLISRAAIHRYVHRCRMAVRLIEIIQPNGHTATVDISVDGGATYKSVSIEARKTAGQDGPSVRPAVAGDNTVYAAFFGWRKFNGTVATSDVVVVRDDTGGTGPNPFQALKDPSDKLPGRLVVQRVSIPWSNAPTLGQERIGSTLSIAVDPNNSSTVYVGWADRGRKGDIYTLHVRRSTDRGLTWSKADLPHTTISNATNIALAVANNGAVGFLYQQLSGGRWVTHIVQSHDAFATVQDVILANVPANTPVQQFLPYLGDYDYLLSVGNEFRGVFCANNSPDLANFPQGVTYQRAADFSTKTLTDGSGNHVAISIDPFYFSVPVKP